MKKTLFLALFSLIFATSLFGQANILVSRETLINNHFYSVVDNGKYILLSPKGKNVTGFSTFEQVGSLDLYTPVAHGFSMEKNISEAKEKIIKNYTDNGYVIDTEDDDGTTVYVLAIHPKTKTKVHVMLFQFKNSPTTECLLATTDEAAELTLKVVMKTVIDMAAENSLLEK